MAVLAQPQTAQAIVPSTLTKAGSSISEDRAGISEVTWVDGAGVLAQELEKVLPCAVATSGEGVDSEGGIIQDTKSVDYSALSALYVEAFKEVSSRLICLENEIKNLRGGTASPEAAMTEAEAAKKDAENLDQADNPNNQ